MDVFKVRDEVIDDYRAFTQGFLTIKDPKIRGKVESDIDSGLLWPEPWLALNPSFESGGSVDALVDEGVLDPTTAKVFRLKEHDKDPGARPITLHRHQRDAIEMAAAGESFVVTTGTGSGKSLTYDIPIVDRILREGSGKGVRAIIVYPMNALANSQLQELHRFLHWGFDGKPPVTVERYTGQESREKRDEILANPPDIILTNYMMLELMLVRPQERKLITASKMLSYLVLDELHTYRGRQGSDVAMLVRRLRQATGASNIQCIGTSATLAGPGTLSEQQAEVAAVASRDFGVTVKPSSVIGETLRRATNGEVDVDALRKRIHTPPPTAYADLHVDPLSVWLEDTFGITVKEGRLARAQPRTLEQASGELAKQTGATEADCAAAIRATLLAGAGKDAVDPSTGKGLFAFKLHQFISRGDTVYQTLAVGDDRWLTTKKQMFKPGDPGSLLYPLAFCRECGQEYLLAALDDSAGYPQFLPREERDQSGEKKTGYLYLSDTESWPDKTDTSALVDRVPEEWVVGTGDERDVSKDRRDFLPEVMSVNTSGTILDTGGIQVAYLDKFRFCLNCSTVYESARGNDFAKLASLGSEGRSSATTVLSASIVRAQQREADITNAASKVLTFTDNRQDASLQAGHFNDFVLVGQIRAALYRAVKDHLDATGKPLEHDELPSKVVQALNLEPAEYAKAPDSKFNIDRATKALRGAVAARVYADLARGWRITMPNLEETGLLKVTYASLDDLAASNDLWSTAGWAHMPDSLAAASASVRERLLVTLLDEMRRNLCVRTEYLTEEGHERIKSQSDSQLIVPWAISDDRPTRALITYPRSKNKGERTGSGHYRTQGLERSHAPSRRQRRHHPCPTGSARQGRTAGQGRRPEGRRPRLSGRRGRTPVAPRRRRTTRHRPTTSHQRSRWTGQPLLPRLLPDPCHKPRRLVSSRTHCASSCGRARRPRSRIPQGRPEGSVLLAYDGTWRRHLHPQRRRHAQRASHPGELRATVRSRRTRWVPSACRDLLRHRVRARPVLLPPLRPHGLRSGGSTPARPVQRGPDSRPRARHLASRNQPRPPRRDARHR
jgi:ATP-dependent helicase YprA (DUF1998 family)